MGLADKSVGMITYSDTQYDYARIPIIQTLTAPPVVFKSKQVPGKRLAALGMEQSYGCIVIEDAQAILGNAFPGNEKGRLSGVINHDDMVYVAHGEMLTAMLGHSGLGKWNSNVESPIVGSPAYLKGTLAVVNANGRMFVYDAETGNKRFTREITPPSMGLVTAAIGFITLLKSGKAELYAPDQLASSTGWSVNLAGEIALPALSVRPKNDNDTEKSVIYFTHDKDVYTASLLNIANGATIWRARLSGKPVAAATGNDRIYVATDDTLLSVYESN
jgi:outer membrane protein assembly factor BamB